MFGRFPARSRGRRRVIEAIEAYRGVNLFARKFARVASQCVASAAIAFDLAPVKTISTRIQQRSV